jgi:hypothetical protein
VLSSLFVGQSDWELLLERTPRGYYYFSTARINTRTRLAIEPEHPGVGGIQMLRDRLTASFGEPGSSHDPVLATTHFPLEAEAQHPVKDGRPEHNSHTDVQGRKQTSDTHNLKFKYRDHSTNRPEATKLESC